MPDAPHNSWDETEVKLDDGRTALVRVVIHEGGQSRQATYSETIAAVSALLPPRTQRKQKRTKRTERT